MKLLNAPQIREFDRIAIEEYGIPGVVLMENAGAGTTRLLLDAIKETPHTQPIAIFAGPGNNGGDGYVIARHLLNKGRIAWTFCCSDPAQLRGDAQRNYQILARMTDAIFDCTSATALAPHLVALSQCSTIVDALLGTGLTRAVDGWFRTLIDGLNDLSGPIKVAVDIPSGLDALTGRPMGTCFQADLTTTYAFPKVGLAMADALPHIGRLEVVDIGAPPAISAETGWVCELQEEEELRQGWPQHDTASHKGTHGHLLVVAGARGTAGAALMTSKAALRMGVGLCTLATPESVHPQIEGRVLELMCQPLPDNPDESDDGSAQLTQLWQHKGAVAIGPGLGQGPTQATWLQTLLANCPQPVIIDADGLNVLVDQMSLLQRAAPTILTPHPGEMARLTGQSTAEIQANRVEVAIAFAKTHGVVLVLKGARTVIASPEGHCWLNPSGNPGLATAGSGDVLTGMIGALLARRCSPIYAARAAVFLHGHTADRIAHQMGYSSIIATDIIQSLPATLAAWERP